MKLNHLSESDVSKLSNNSITFTREPDCKEGILLIYADWCGHCVRFKPVYEYLTEIFDTLYKDGSYKLNKNETLISTKNSVPKFWAIKHDEKRDDIKFVRGFPSIYIISDINDKKGNMKLHSGERNIEDLLKYFKSNISISSS